MSESETSQMNTSPNSPSADLPMMEHAALEKSAADDQTAPLSNPAEDRISDSTFLELLRKLGHDIRAPLGSIISTSDMLAEGVYEPLNSRQARANERVRRNSRRVLTMVDDFITYLKAEAGEIILTPEAFDPRSLLSSRCEEIRPHAEGKGLILELIIQESIPAALIGDSAAVKRVITALLWNAVAFTPQGSIRVESDWSDDDQWLITVQDTGIGIPPENAAHIFEPFWRGEERPEVPTAGVGLGLPLARAVIRRMQGQLFVEQTGSSGSVFCVRLPLSRSVL